MPEPEKRNSLLFKRLLRIFLAQRFKQASSASPANCRKFSSLMVSHNITVSNYSQRISSRIGLTSGRYDSEYCVCFDDQEVAHAGTITTDHKPDFPSKLGAKLVGIIFIVDIALASGNTKLVGVFVQAVPMSDAPKPLRGQNSE